VDDANKVYAAPLNSENSSAVRISGFVEFGESFDRIETPNKQERDLSIFQAQTLLSSASKFFPKGFIRDTCELSLTFDDDDDDDKTVEKNNNEVIRAHVCMRPQTPDDLPIIGRSNVLKNVFYNAGHGHLGWTRAVGASRILVECVEGWSCENKIDGENSLIPSAIKIFRDFDAYSPSRWLWF